MPPENKKGFVRDNWDKLVRGTVNRVVGGVFQRYGAKRYPQETAEREKQPADIKTELATITERKNSLLEQLRRLETNWNEVEYMIWGEFDKDYEGTLVDTYKKISYYNDPEMCRVEASCYRSGTGLKRILNKPIRGTPLNYTGYELKSRPIFYIEPDGEVIYEDLYSLGYNNVTRMQDMLNEQFTSWTNSATAAGLDFIETAISAKGVLLEFLTECRTREIDFHKDHLDGILGIWRGMENTRGRLHELRPKNIRFLHTYEIIAPVVSKKVEGGGDQREVVYFKDSPEGRDFRLFQEVAPGLDENGYPLEVEQQSDGKWVVLLDKWWHEISQNGWQKTIIRNKKGGARILRIIDYFSNPSNIRSVPEDSIFVKNLDLLEMATYISNEYDSFRDDLRDGRYHPWSKTMADYILAAEGGHWDLRYKSYESIIPKKPIRGTFAPMAGYVTATPESFRNMPDDEAKVKRGYVMKTWKEIEGKLYEKDVRKPSHLNPAFDRRALNSRSDTGPDRFYLHWGRMLYYEDTSGINKWSENPFPHCSTRGVSSYIIYRLLKDLSYEDAVREGRDTMGYDYGVRRPIVGGDFIKDPIGGSDVIQPESSG